MSTSLAPFGLDPDWPRILEQHHICCPSCGNRVRGEYRLGLMHGAQIPHHKWCR